MKTSHAHPESYYPVFLDLRGKPCVVVGGGKVAERKALALLRVGARLKVISPSLTLRLRQERDRGSLRHLKRKFRRGDLRGAFLVIAATDDPQENAAVAEHQSMLVNVADQPELCNFIVPSTVRRGPLAIAISTSGASPAMARAIRRDIEALYGKAFGTYLRRLRRERQKALEEIGDARKRQRLLKSLASDGIVSMLRKGRVPGPCR